jgi:hypothetical protein
LSTLFCKTLVTVDAFIQNLYMQNGVMTNGGVLQSANYDPVDETGWMIKYNGEAFFQGVKIDANSITVKGKGYAPVGMVYIQFYGKKDPREIFSGTWDNITNKYAGLFFRAEGWTVTPNGQLAAAGSWGEVQNADIIPHTHRPHETMSKPTLGSGQTFWSNSSYWLDPMLNFGETRPANTAIRLWYKYAKS